MWFTYKGEVWKRSSKNVYDKYDNFGRKLNKVWYCPYLSQIVTDNDFCDKLAEGQIVQINAPNFQKPPAWPRIFKTRGFSMKPFNYYYFSDNACIRLNKGNGEIINFSGSISSLTQSEVIEVLDSERQQLIRDLFGQAAKNARVEPNPT